MAARERTVAMITNPPILSSNWTACSGDDFTEIDLYDFTTYDVPDQGLGRGMIYEGIR